MFRAFAEDPHGYIPLGPGEACLTNDRYVLATRPGGQIHANVALRLRLDGARVVETVNEIRALVADRKNPKVTWLVGSSATPKNLTERLIELGAAPKASDPVLGAMVCTRPLAMNSTEVVVKTIATREDYAAARAIDRTAFKLEGEETEAEIEHEFALQCETDFRRQYLAFIGGEPIATASSIFTEHGVMLSGGSTLPAFRGHGAYRALVHARWVDAVARNTPALVTHAGQMSRPILESLGFECISEVALLIDA